MTDHAPAHAVTSAPVRAGGIGRPALRQRAWLWRRYWLRDPLLGGLDYAIHHSSRLLPTDFGSALGARLGLLNGRYRYHTERRRAERLYRRFRGESAERDVAAAVMSLFATAGRTMLEFSVLDRLWREGRIAVSGREHLLAARAAGRPVIVMGLHLNNWEVIGPALIGLGLSGFKFIYQPPRSRFEHHIAVAARRRYGAIMLRPGVMAARIARRLLVEERGVLLIFADDERRGRINAPLFGRPIAPRANLPTIVRLAWASGAAVIPAYAERDPERGGARFHVKFLPPADLLPGDDEAPLSENIHRLDAIITPIVLDRLDQWYMLFDYRRD
ncbi:MAG: lysophospholipid acyltransferase family protein [Thiohalocapsa sp.]